jgi:hypothetical protein
MSDKEKPDLVKATFENDDEKVLDLLDQGVDPNQQDEDGNTALHFAVLNGNIDIISNLWDLEANPNIKNKAGIYPIMNAFGKKNTRKIVATLLLMGADPKLSFTLQYADRDNVLKALLTKNIEPNMILDLYSTKEYKHLYKYLKPDEPERPESPRTKYNEATRENNIIMIEGEKHDLFQVRLSEPDKLFGKYKSLSSIGINDCTYQTLFSLGLMNRDSAMVGSKSMAFAQSIRPEQNHGVLTESIIKHINSVFGLEEETIDETQYNAKEGHFITGVSLHDFLIDKLKPDCATILSLDQEKNISHFVVAYRTESGLYIFDPQRTRRRDVPSIYPVIELDKIFGKCSGFSVIVFTQDVEEKIIQQEYCSLNMPVTSLGGGKKTKKKKMIRKRSISGKIRNTLGKMRSTLGKMRSTLGKMRSTLGKIRKTKQRK